MIPVRGRRNLAFSVKDATMNSRESAVARDESVKGARWALLHEKSDPLLRRYLGASLIKTLAEGRRERRSDHRRAPTVSHDEASAVTGMAPDRPTR